MWVMQALDDAENEDNFKLAGLDVVSRWCGVDHNQFGWSMGLRSDPLVGTPYSQAIVGS